MPGPLSLPHLAAIEAVLRTLAGECTTGEARRDVARAYIVLEDASVALTLGLQLGLTLDQIVEQCRQILAQERAEQPDRGGISH